MPYDLDVEGPSRQKLQDIFKAAGVVGVWDWDVLADRVYADAGVFELFNISRPPCSNGVPLEDFIQNIYPEDRERVRLQRRRSMETGRLHITEFRSLRPDGSLRMLRGRGRFRYDARGRPIRFVGITIDLSEQFDDDRRAAATEVWSHPLELIADNCVAAHEVAEKSGYGTLAHLLRMAMIEVGTSLAKLGNIARIHSLTQHALLRPTHSTHGRTHIDAASARADSAPNSAEESGHAPGTDQGRCRR